MSVNVDRYTLPNYKRGVMLTETITEADLKKILVEVQIQAINALHSLNVAWELQGKHHYAKTHRDHCTTIKDQYIAYTRAIKE